MQILSILHTTVVRLVFLNYKNQMFFIFNSSSNDDIIAMIMEGEHDDFGAEKLKGLMKILPEMVSNLNFYSAFHIFRVHKSILKVVMEIS